MVCRGNCVKWHWAGEPVQVINISCYYYINYYNPYGLARNRVSTFHLYTYTPIRRYMKVNYYGIQNQKAGKVDICKRI